MSKSNNHHCTPDAVGEQKGESSPFFHINGKENSKRILLETYPNLVFSSDGEIEEFSTFFHEERRERFLRLSEKALLERRASAEDFSRLKQKLAMSLSELAELFSAPMNEKEKLSENCAHRSLAVLQKENKIRNNILVSVNNHLIFLNNNSTFLQIQKEALFFHAATKELGCPQDTAPFLQMPPERLIGWFSALSELYEKVELRLSRQLLAAAKAAKAQNAEKYEGILHETVAYLYDILGLLRAIGTEDQNAKIPSCP